MMAMPRSYFDLERAGFRRVLALLPPEDRKARWLEVARVWNRVRSERPGHGISAGEMTTGWPGGYYSPSRFGGR
jgi:hypothetical protein